MNKNIEHYFFHKKNFLEKDCCDDYVNELSSVRGEKHTWYRVRSDELRYPSGDNEPEEFYEDGKINQDIIDKLHPVILEYIKSFKFDYAYSQSTMIFYHIMYKKRDRHRRVLYLPHLIENHRRNYYFSCRTTFSD